MPGTEQLSYKIEKYERLATVDGLRVSILTLAEGEEVPWHSHTKIDDDFFCMEGPMQVETRRPDGTQILQPVTISRILEQPHPGKLLYERRGIMAFNKFNKKVQDFIKSNITKINTS